MSVRRRSWRDSQGREHKRWMIHVEYTAPDGSKKTIRKVSPVQSKRGAEAFEQAQGGGQDLPREIAPELGDGLLGELADEDL